MSDKPLPILPFEVFKDMAAAVEARPRPPTKEYIDAELAKCRADAVYFVNTYCYIYDNDTQGWIPFALWPFQASALQIASQVDETGELVYKRLIALKTRQIGFTWLFADAHKLWKMLFRPITEVLVFSQSDEDAMAILSDQRMKGMYERLPDWMKGEVSVDSAHEFRLKNGSGIRALPESRGGDSRTVTDVVIDEADLITDLTNLIARAEPTLGMKGQLIVIGRAVKEKPNSPFKRLYLSAKKNMLEGLPSRWNKSIFVAWFDHPKRTPEWKAALDHETLARDFTLDYVQEHYPSTDLEALSSRTLDKRFAPQKIAALTNEMIPVGVVGKPDIPGLRVYLPPEKGRRYGIGADPAGGLPKGDDSYLQVIDAESFEQCAVLQGKIEPETFANNAADLSVWYNNALVLFELNNHGHAFLLQARRRGVSLQMGLNRRGEKERRVGWLTTETSKNTLYDGAASAMNAVLEETRDENNNLHLELVRPILHDFVTSAQLSSIDIETLSAPEGDHDDASMSWVLAVRCVYAGGSSMERVPHNLWNHAPEQPSKHVTTGQPSPMPHLPKRPPMPVPFASGTDKPLNYAQIQAKLKERGIRRTR